MAIPHHIDEECKVQTIDVACPKCGEFYESGKEILLQQYLFDMRHLRKVKRCLCRECGVPLEFLYGLFVRWVFLDLFAIQFS